MYFRSLLQFLVIVWSFNLWTQGCYYKPNRSIPLHLKAFQRFRYDWLIYSFTLVYQSGGYPEKQCLSSWGPLHGLTDTIMTDIHRKIQCIKSHKQAFNQMIPDTNNKGREMKLKKKKEVSIVLLIQNIKKNPHTLTCTHINKAVSRFSSCLFLFIHWWSQIRA